MNVSWRNCKMFSKPWMLTVPSTARQSSVWRSMRKARHSMGRSCLAMALLVMLAAGQPTLAASGARPKYQRIPTQYIAALGEPGATSGSGAQLWGLWPVDPGPRGIKLDTYDKLKSTGGMTPAHWQFDSTDWWLEEHGLIMEQPVFPVPPRKYVVTGGRDAVAVLTIHPADKNGNARWELDNGATLYDVTHLGCRSARYLPDTGAGSCSPASAQQKAFPVAPGAVMPPVNGCKKQDYAVLLVIGVPADD
jgi:hypothetical protein